MSAFPPWQTLRPPAFVRAAPLRGGRVGVDPRDDILHRPQTIRNPCGHRRGQAQRLRDAAEGVEGEVERQRVNGVVQLLAERIGEAGEGRMDIRIVRFRRSK
jgi:hypothetical protein